MTEPLTAISLFAGIEGFGYGLAQAGVRVVAAVEIDPAARGVIADHYPDTILFNDVTEVTGDQLRATGFVPDRGVVVGGWPCQDLSVAGRREGLGGARSGLFWEAVRLLADLRPRWFILENVPGLLSAVCPGRPAATEPDQLLLDGGEADGLTTGRGACPGGCMASHGGAMGLVVGALGELGYGLAWRSLDAQFWGVPQRRRRVFFVGRLGDGAAPVEVLFEPESSGGNLAQSGPARAGVASVAALSASDGGADDNDAPGGRLIVGPLQAAGTNGKGHRVDAEGAATGHLVVASALRARPQSKGVDSDATDTLIVSAAQITHAPTSEGHDASEDGTGRGTPLVAFDWKTSGSDRPRPNVSTSRTSALRTGHQDAIASAEAVRRLSPLECEALQGFPPGWTATSNSVPQSDSARYRQLGNAVATPVVAWIARRIVAVDAALTAEPSL